MSNNSVRHDYLWLAVTMYKDDLAHDFTRTMNTKQHPVSSTSDMLHFAFLR